MCFLSHYSPDILFVVLPGLKTFFQINNSTHSSALKGSESILDLWRRFCCACLAPSNPLLAPKKSSKYFLSLLMPRELPTLEKWSSISNL